MTDRLSLTNALADGNIERKAADRIATEIFDGIHQQKGRDSPGRTAQRDSRSYNVSPATISRLTAL